MTRIIKALAFTLLLASNPAVAQDDFDRAATLSALLAAVPVAPGTDLRSDREPQRADALTIFKQGDLTGIWHVHLWFQSTSPLWVACTVKIKAGGEVRAGDKCRVYDPEDDEFFNTTTSGGSFKISKAGKITGKLIIGSSTQNISDAWMQRTKDYFQAVGRCKCAAIEMSGVKR